MSRKFQPKTKEYAQLKVVTSDDVYISNDKFNPKYEVFGKVERVMPNVVIKANKVNQKTKFIEDTSNLTKKIKGELVDFFMNEKTKKGNARKKAYLVKEKQKKKGK